MCVYLRCCERRGNSEVRVTFIRSIRLHCVIYPLLAKLETQVPLNFMTFINVNKVCYFQRILKHKTLILLFRYKSV